MTKEELAKHMDETFLRLQALRKAGQAEYAHGDNNAFANFERIATQLKMDRKQVLWVYVMKHLDGIVSHINGYVSQREDVGGRIDDVEVYLELLRAMIWEDKLQNSAGGMIGKGGQDHQSGLLQGRG